MRALSDLSYLPIRAALPSIDLGGPVTQVAARLAATLGDDVLAVDDLHWCDADTLALVAELVQRHPVIGVVRPDPGPAAVPWPCSSRWGRCSSSARSTTSRHARSCSGCDPGAPTSDVDEALRQSRGNPLDLVLFAAGDERGPERGVAAELAVADLRPTDLRALARLAASGRPATLDADQAQRLVARGVAVIDARGGYAPRHDLVAEAALALVGPDARRALHAELAAEATDAATRAVHLAAADDHAAAVEAAREAAREASTVSSRAVFLQLEAEHTRPPDPTITLVAADALSRAGRYDLSLGLLAELAPEGVGAELALIRARDFWSMNDVGSTRMAIDEGLTAADLTPTIAAELRALSLPAPRPDRLGPRRCDRRRHGGAPTR